MSSDSVGRFRVTIDAEVLVTDLDELRTWVLDHLPSDCSFEPDWEDREEFDEETNSYPKKDVVLAGEEAVYVLDNADSLVDLVGLVLIYTVPGIEVLST
jgi:hypothetical protein